MILHPLPAEYGISFRGPNTLVTGLQLTVIVLRMMIYNQSYQNVN